MNQDCEKYTTDIVALKRPTTLDKLAETIAKPKGAIPNFGLPKWKVMPMESKIPMVPGPEGAYNFTRRKLGKGLWISGPDAEFNLSDPYGYEIKWTYDSLHDKHLVPYFARPNIVRHLIKSGFITKNRDAKCSLRDYNMYRRYLRRLHCDSIKKELNRITKRSVEERAIEYAQEQAEKEVKRLKERERLTLLRSSAIREREMAEKLKRQEQKEKQRKIEERLQALDLKKREDQHLRHIQSRARAELIQQKQKAAADFRRRKIIQTLLEWSKKERVRKKMMEIRLAHERERKKEIVKQKWEERLEFQKKQIEKEQFLLQCVEDQRKQYIETYKEKVDRETERMKKLFKDMKMYVRCYLARRMAGSKERICCENYFRDDEEDDVPLPMKSDKKKEVSMRYASSLPGKRDQIQIKDRDKKSPQEERKKGKQKGMIKAKLKQKKKGQAKVKRKKVGSGKKAGKRRRKGKKRRKAKKEKDTQLEETSELQVVPESIASTKTETSEASTVSGPTDNCRCQIIRDAQKAIIQ